MCFTVFTALARAVGVTAPTMAVDLIAVGIWVLCDIELLKLFFGKR